MIALLLALASCPSGVDPRACAALDSCVDDLAAQPLPATPGVEGLARDLAIVADRFERCALSAYSLAIARAGTIQTITSTVFLPVACPPCPSQDSGDGSWALAVVGVGACALCGGASSAIALAMCPGGP